MTVAALIWFGAVAAVAALIVTAPYGWEDETGFHHGKRDETISNAENECTDLNPVTLLRIPYEFDEEIFQPVRELYLCRHKEPETPSERFDRALRDLEAVKRETVG